MGLWAKLREILTQSEANANAIADLITRAKGLDEIYDKIFKTGGMGGGVASKTIIYNGSIGYGAFNITGVVAVRVIGEIIIPLSNHVDQTSVGTNTSPAGLIAATPGTAMQVVNYIWVDNTPSRFEVNLPNPCLISRESINVVGTVNLVAGSITLYCIWTPISDGGNVIPV